MPISDTRYAGWLSLLSCPAETLGAAGSAGSGRGTKLTVRMGMLEHGKIVYVEEKADLMPGNSLPNRARLPVHSTALGETLLAYGLASNHV
jgi:hypothetical protein